MKNVAKQTTWHFAVKESLTIVKAQMTPLRLHFMRNSAPGDSIVRRAGRHLRANEIANCNQKISMKGGGSNGAIQFRLLGNTYGV